LNACFISRLEHLMDGARVRLWIHGHTHDSFDYTVNGTRVVCNPRGYAKNGVNENARFDPDYIVEIG
jgi:Icc-related predicted phosphoesterase